MTEENKLTLNGVLWGVVIPVIIGIVIILFPTAIGPALNSAFPPDSDLSYIPQILTHGFAVMAMFGVPLFVGLTWSKWAGGVAGFLCGTLYYLGYAGYYTAVIGFNVDFNMYRDPSFIGNYIVGGILIGYIAGALSNKSFRIKRMLGAALTATIIVGVFQFVLNYTVSFAAYMTQNDPLFALFATMLPMIILGILVPIVARISAGGELWHM